EVVGPDNERGARRAARATIVNGVNQVFEIDRLLPQPIDTRGRGPERQPIVHIGGSRVVADAADLQMAFAPPAMLGQQTVAYTALGTVDDGTPHHRRAAACIPVAD